MVIWRDRGSDGLGPGRLWGRVVGPDGQPEGDEFAISDEPVDGANNVNNAVVAASGRREVFLVVWDQEQPNGQVQVRAQRFDERGHGISPEFVVAPTKAHLPAVAYGSERHEFLVTWKGYAKPGIYAARIPEESSSAPTVFRVYRNTESDIRDSAVAYNSRRDNYMVVWDELRLRGRTVPAQPTGKLGRARTLSQAKGRVDVSLRPSIAFSARANEYAATWNQGTPDELLAFTRRISARGRPLGGEVSVGDADTIDADIAPRRRGGYRVVYQYDRNFDENGGEIVLSLRLKRDLDEGDPSPVSSDKPDRRGSQPAIVYSPAEGRFRVVWVEGPLQHGAGLVHNEVFTRRL